MSDENEVQEDEVIQQDELSADLAAAWDDSVEESDDGTAEIGTTPGDDQPDDDTADTELPTDVEASSETEDGESAGNLDTDAAPDSLPPAAREAWGETPQVMREAIAKREKDFAAGIMKYAQGAKQAGQMNELIKPYGQYIQMNGGPGKAIGSLLQTGSQLQMGSPQQKAQIVADLINQFGVDIGSLDNMLVGAAPSASDQQNSAVQQAVQQAVAPYQQTMNQIQQQQQHASQQQNQAIAGELGEFAKTHEFYNDLRGEMATMLENASAQGREMTPQKAYDIAAAMHPQIGPIVAARKNTASLADKRKAAVSITGNQGGAADRSAADDMNSQINAAWDAVGRS
jgi:hypothetical protein